MADVTGKHAEASAALHARLKGGPFIIAGPCVLESYELADEVAAVIAEAAAKYGITPIFKSSYVKANRSSLDGFRGPGLEKGLEWLERIGKKYKLPVLTDVHESTEVPEVASVVDVLQIPAFLCRQTLLLLAAGESGRVVNVKKGQFLSPWEMGKVAEKVCSTGNKHVVLTERGNSFGYNNLVVDMRSFPVMRKFGFPVVMDATHAVQLPGSQGACSGGDRRFVPAIARAAVAAGADGVFTECHPNPDKALCDGPNSLHLRDLPRLLCSLSSLWALRGEWDVDAV